MRQDLGEQRATHRRGYQAAPLDEFAVLTHVLDQAHLDTRLQIHRTAFVGAVRLIDVGKEDAFTARADALARQVIETEHHVLRGHDDRIAVGGERMLLEDIISARASS